MANRPSPATKLCESIPAVQKALNDALLHSVCLFCMPLSESNHSRTLLITIQTNGIPYFERRYRQSVLFFSDLLGFWFHILHARKPVGTFRPIIIMSDETPWWSHDECNLFNSTHIQMAPTSTQPNTSMCWYFSGCTFKVSENSAIVFVAPAPCNITVSASRIASSWVALVPMSL
jgi:hypothetical protein